MSLVNLSFIVMDVSAVIMVLAFVVDSVCDSRFALSIREHILLEAIERAKPPLETKLVEGEYGWKLQEVHNRAVVEYHDNLLRELGLEDTSNGEHD